MKESRFYYIQIFDVATPKNEKGNFWILGPMNIISNLH